MKDLKQMSQKEKMKLLKKESPELPELIQDFKTKVEHTLINRYGQDVYCGAVVYLLCQCMMHPANRTEGGAAASSENGQGWKDTTGEGELCL